MVKADAHCPNVTITQELIPFHGQYSFVAVMLFLAITNNTHF